MSDELVVVPHYSMCRSQGGHVAATPRGGILPLYGSECRHSNEFNWGYPGSGPAQLAYCLLRHSLKSGSAAWLMHMRLKRDVVSRVGLERWGITPAYLRRWAHEDDGGAELWPGVWVARCDVDLAGTLGRADRVERAAVLGMIADEALEPLIDLLADLGGLEHPRLAALTLLAGEQEGRVIV